MALEGQLSDFNLAEILQLLASQQKTGFLNIETNRNLVFIFEKGVLISTRDRRSRERDPLESFLRAYGWFTEAQWKHIEYVGQNSSLDLTEILVSEGLMDDAELERALRGLAQEMTHAGMKLRRGRYYFSPCKDTPPGVKHRYHVDVQGLLMEAARRLDEEPLLKEVLPSQSITFTAGRKVVPPEALSPTAQRIMELALSGSTLGRIIRQGKAESFVVRDLLKTWCQEEVLVKHLPVEEDDDEGEGGHGLALPRTPGLRSVPLTVAGVVLMGALLGARFTMLPAPTDDPGRPLRLSQLRYEVLTAAQLYRYQQGQWPENLQALVRAGQLGPSVAGTVESLGWQYSLDTVNDSFSLSS
ncbi:MAG: DUF4388 domain-containing protein [bacterium]|jgi:hypothetical protein|nr:DUF4388 domain-containing protein [bacterium]